MEVSKKQLKATATKAKKKHKSSVKHSSDNFDFEHLEGGLSADEAIAALDAMLHDDKDIMGKLSEVDNLDEDKSHHHTHHHHSHHHHNASSAADDNAAFAEDNSTSAEDNSISVAAGADAVAEVPTLAPKLSAPPAEDVNPEPPAPEQLVEPVADAVAETLAETPAVEPAVQPVEHVEQLVAPVAVPAAQPAQVVAPNGPMEQQVLQITGGKLNQGGYGKIADLHNTALMASYIRLVVAANGGTISDENSLLGFAPYHSGERGVQSYVRLLRELRKETWTTLGKAGSDVPLDEDGYKSIVSTKDSAKMASFIARVVSLYGGNLTSPEKVTWFSKYHSGEKSSQSFKQLISQLRKVDWVSGMERDDVSQI